MMHTLGSRRLHHKLAILGREMTLAASDHPPTIERALPQRTVRRTGCGEAFRGRRNTSNPSMIHSSRLMRLAWAFR